MSTTAHIVLVVYPPPCGRTVLQWRALRLVPEVYIVLVVYPPPCGRTVLQWGALRIVPEVYICCFTIVPEETISKTLSYHAERARQV